MKKIKVGITGQPGFIGTHLYNLLNLHPNSFDLIAFEDRFFDDESILGEFTGRCDYIVHLAAVNRHHDPNEIFSKNIELVEKLIKAMSRSGSRAHVIFSSSTQEERNNVYGQSKKEGRKLLIEWAFRNKSGFSGLVIPNVFGPFGRPYYNSVIATFSHQIIIGEEPNVEIDADLNLIFVGELTTKIKELILNEPLRNKINEYYPIESQKQISVSKILSRLKTFDGQYLQQGIIPSLQDQFDIDLFNTFRSYIKLKKHFPVKYLVNQDDRGIFVETIKLNTGGQVSFSTTKPGITRGNHFHTRKIERFAVIKGEALIQLRRVGTSEIIEFHLSGQHPSFVDMPVWYTHNITNIGDTELLTIFWINEFYDESDPDTFYEKV